MNPYYHQTFFQFLWTLLKRLWLFCTGSLAYHDLASDEVQLLVLWSIAISASTVGTFLILRQMSLLANSLSHTILLGIVIAFVVSGAEDPHEISLTLLLFAAVFTGLVTTFLTEFLTKTAKLQADASLGVVFSALFSLGVILVTLLTRNTHIGVLAVMGNVDALNIGDVPLSLAILGINLLLFTLFFKEYQMSTFDPALAAVFGFFPVFFNYLLMAQTSLTAIGAFRAVGVLMVLAFMVVPPLTARMLTHRLRTLLFGAAGFGVFASLVGVALSRHFLTAYGAALSTGGLVVCVMALLFVFTVGWTYARATRG